MRKLLLCAALGVLLAGCANTAQVNATISLGDACNGLANAIDKVTPLKIAGKLDAATIGAVDNAIVLTTPLCASGTSPTNLAGAIALVSGEAAAILAIVASKGSAG